jgi:hypothetical protein
MGQPAAARRLSDMSTTLSSAQAPRDAVQSWRLEQPPGAGYSRLDAVVLSERTEIDLHVAVRLLEHNERIAIGTKATRHATVNRRRREEP